MGKTWRQKFDTRKSPVVEPLAKEWAGQKAGSMMLISTPAEIDAEVRAIPSGQKLEIAELRMRLAQRHQADFTCPLTASLFLRIVAELSLEQMAEGKEPAPFWRVVDPNSPLARKLSCGPDFVQAQREAEGIA